MPVDNPFSRHLRDRLGKRQTEARRLVECWDNLEVLVIGVYRSGAVEADDERALAHIRAWMGRHYPAVEVELREHWWGLRSGGEPVKQDPFRRLFEVESASSFVDNWAAMQTLPAAREALNRWLLSRSASG